MSRKLMVGLPPPFPTTLHPSIIHPPGAIIPWKVGTTKRQVREASIPRGWVRVETSVVQLKPRSDYNSSNGMVYIMYLRKVG